MSEKYKIIFETTDPMQNVIYPTSDRFEHITYGHPEMYEEENNIKLAVEEFLIMYTRTKILTPRQKSQNKKTPRLDVSFHYDSEADILYASVGKPKPAKSIDFPNGIVLRIDPTSGNYIGFTIINYMARKKSGSIKKIPQFNSVELPVYSYPS